MYCPVCLKDTDGTECPECLCETIDFCEPPHHTTHREIMTNPLRREDD